MPGVIFQLFKCYIVTSNGKKSTSTKKISTTNLIYKIMFLMVCCSLMDDTGVHVDSRGLHIV